MHISDCQGDYNIIRITKNTQLTEKRKNGARENTYIKVGSKNETHLDTIDFAIIGFTNPVSCAIKMWQILKLLC